MAAKLRKRDDCGRCAGDGGGLLLPEEIILEVLLRLPAKDLCRFRCVCKSWHALISDPAFVAALRSRATGPLMVAMFWACGQELRLLDKGGNVLMVFDVRDQTGSPAPTCLDHHIFVNRAKLGAMIIDPASGRNFTIVGTKDPPPPPPWADSGMTIEDYSFGRVTASGDYKVLHLATWSYCFHHNQWCQVATIMDGGADLTWRQRPWGPFYGASFSSEDKATVNGVLYFMLHNVNSTESHGRTRIASFDLESEEWKSRNIKGPLLGHRNKYDKWHITLTELKGTLCMVYNVKYLADLVGHYADIWLLKDPISCDWVKEYKIKTPVERLFLFTQPLAVLNDGKLLLLNEFRNTNDHRRYIVSHYNSSSKAFTEFVEMAPGFIGEMAFYTGSLKS